MYESNRHTISIPLALREAVAGFRGWWLPLCLVSTVIMFSQSWLPHLLQKMFREVKVLEPYLNAFNQFKQNILSITHADTAFAQLRESIASISSDPTANYEIRMVLIKLMLLFFIVLLFLCALYIVTIVMSKSSIKQVIGKQTNLKKDFTKTPLLSLSYLSLSILQSLPFIISLGIPIIYILLSIHYSSDTHSRALGIMHFSEFLVLFLTTICCFLFSSYIYIRFYFTGFVITEKSANPFYAIIGSWKMTKGHFSKLIIIFIITIIIDIISIITVIGFIPGTGLKYTLRASAYEQILAEDDPAVAG